MPKNTLTRSRGAGAPKQTHRNTATPKPVAPINKTWEAEYAAENARLAATLHLTDLGDRERAFLATCQKIHRRSRGCDSPFEDFFNSLIILVELGHWPTPDDVADKLATFREDFEFMRESTRNFIEAYPPAPASTVASA